MNSAISRWQSGENNQYDFGFFVCGSIKDDKFLLMNRNHKWLVTGLSNLPTISKINRLMNSFIG